MDEGGRVLRLNLHPCIIKIFFGVLNKQSYTKKVAFIRQNMYKNKSPMITDFFILYMKKTKNYITL